MLELVPTDSSSVISGKTTIPISDVRLESAGLLGLGTCMRVREGLVLVPHAGKVCRISRV